MTVSLHNYVQRFANGGAPVDRGTVPERHVPWKIVDGSSACLAVHSTGAVQNCREMNNALSASTVMLHYGWPMLAWHQCERNEFPLLGDTDGVVPTMISAGHASVTDQRGLRVACEVLGLDLRLVRSKKIFDQTTKNLNKYEYPAAYWSDDINKCLILGADGAILNREDNMIHMAAGRRCHYLGFIRFVTNWNHGTKAQSFDRTDVSLDASGPPESYWESLV